jgi:hypothetical protein
VWENVDDKQDKPEKHINLATTNLDLLAELLSGFKLFHVGFTFYTRARRQPDVLNRVQESAKREAE